MAFQRLNGQEVDEVVCPFTGSNQVEKAHIISHASSSEYRIKFWLRMLGETDTRLGGVTNVWPLCRTLHKWLDASRPLAVIYPSEATAIKAIRLAELALASHEQSSQAFELAPDDFLHGWTECHVVDDTAYRYFHNKLGICVDANKLTNAVVGVKREGKPQFLQGWSDTGQFWPLSTQPELHTAQLPLDLTCVQLKLLDWVGKGLGAEERPLSPDLARAVSLADYRLSLIETATTSSWRCLHRPPLPFDRPPRPITLPQRIPPIPPQLRRYHHPRRSRAPSPTEEPLYSSSPPPLYRTADILQLLRTTTVSTGPSGSERKRKRGEEDDDGEDDQEDDQEDGEQISENSGKQTKEGRKLSGLDLQRTAF